MAFAQTVEPASAPAAPQGPDRSGFSLLLTLGLGLQKVASSDMETGLGGLNLGIGGFVSPDLAVMFRFSGTSVTYDEWYGNIDFTSGVGGPCVQYWVDDSINLEGGLGLGFADNGEGWDDQGFGVILGFGYSFYHKKKTSFQMGVELAPAFIDGETIHNISIAFGWQLL
ncbi:MAG: hypothetical protein ABFS42_14740 [Candidatus Krumholzibacteriota bacterium]